MLSLAFRCVQSWSSTPQQTRFRTFPLRRLIQSSNPPGTWALHSFVGQGFDCYSLFDQVKRKAVRLIPLWPRVCNHFPLSIAVILVSVFPNWVYQFPFSWPSFAVLVFRPPVIPTKPSALDAKLSLLQPSFIPRNTRLWSSLPLYGFSTTCNLYF